MFTGIVIERGAVRRARMRGGLLELEVEAPKVARELGVGDSVAVNGVCLTAKTASRRRFTAQAIGETLARTTLGGLDKGANVNLELPARITDRLGGHLVQGHVDGTAPVLRIEDFDGARRVWFAAEEDLLRFMVDKGSVTLDGVSLTLTEVGRTTFQVALIPHTLEATTFGRLQVGSPVNVEVDVIAKYVARLMAKD
ncbi:MAG TPA: riboflavin synthase [Actinomycetota bacterium]|nr:riboflavin synthase [Actinomycetota bacterium]